MAAVAAGAGLALVVAGSVLRPAAGASAAASPVLGYDPADTGSPSSVSRLVGAQGAWAAGYTGAGVDVAVIDTGVSPVPGLDAAGKIITGPDLSPDAAGAATPGLDGFGHGTFMAGLIAGRDAGATASSVGCTTCLNSSGYSDTMTFVGIAPDARIVNVKVGAADGAADVTQVVAAIDWVVQHARDPGFNIRVISLSYGTDSAQAYTVDPLAQAAEQAWRHGVVVVAAAGNDGKASRQLADPGYDPFVIAAGGDDPLGTLDSSDDVVPSFAQHGNTQRPVDVVAPAAHVIGLRVPGSFVDTLADNTGQVGTRFQRGSGTSEATAIVSGAAALVLQRYPSATPDQVKALLNGTATKLASGNAQAPGQRVHWGFGIVNAAAAVAAALPSAARATQTDRASTGVGALDLTRNGVYVTDGGVDLTGQKDIFGQPFHGAAMASAQADASAWSGGVWNGHRWSGDTWDGHRWSTAAWTGVDWAGHAWDGHRWSGMAWDGHRWSGSGWATAGWTGGTWDDSRWASAAWG
ncbi:MAG TPA: S8 family serine peptidase [Kineosporiaceae bacterium]